MKINLNINYYDYIRNADDSEKQWEYLKDEVEGQALEELELVPYNQIVPARDMDLYKEGILSNIESFIIWNLNDEGSMAETDMQYYESLLQENINFPITYKGEYKYMNRTERVEIAFNNWKTLMEFLTSRGIRGIHPILEGNTIIIPVRDLGGGIVLNAILKETR